MNWYDVRIVQIDDESVVVRRMIIVVDEHYYHSITYLSLLYKLRPYKNAINLTIFRTILIELFARKYLTTTMAHHCNYFLQLVLYTHTQLEFNRFSCHHNIALLPISEDY